MPRKKRCRSLLHYETMARVIRVYRVVDGRRRYRFRCPTCNHEGENDGRAQTCSRPSIPG